MARFRMKPIAIEAVKYRDSPEGRAAVVGFCGPSTAIWPAMVENRVAIYTLEGRLSDVRDGDWIIRDAGGEFHPCRPDVFAANYEPEDNVL
jgi:hypothetical protein